MIRDILDWQGNKIGELELPNDTTEEQWAQALAPYAVAPPDGSAQLENALTRTVLRSREIADEIIESFKKRNLRYFIENGVSNDLAILKSLWVHHRLRALDITVSGLPLTIDLMNLCISGDLETAYVVLIYMEPDDMSQPFHFLSADVIAELAQSIKDRIEM
jgi:hypothetical protein